MNFDYDIWPAVRQHIWKWRQRSQPIRLIQLHATRSGRTHTRLGRLWTMEDERKSTTNWFKSSNNRVAGAPHEAAMASVLIGNGTLTQVMPDDIEPHHSLGHADRSGLSIEICQPRDNVPFLPEDLELAAQYCAEKSTLYDIPVVVLPFLSADNHEAPGYVRHDRSNNGRRLGKSDPGSNFDDAQFIVRVKSYMEDDMAEAIDRLNKQAVLLKLAAIYGAGQKPTAEEKWWGMAVLDS